MKPSTENYKSESKNCNELKVLMALMEMDIGGAETHVLELCKALRRKGIDIYVMSNGGAYEAELTDNGIKHFQAPLHNKNILNMFKSYRLLKKIIVENDIKLVHAHARIPGFLCGILQKRLKFRLVTTVHGIYNTAMPYRMLTNWGEKTLSVSEDLKRYLMDNYKIPENNIFMTINGIDTKKFSKDTDCTSLYSEFNIDSNSRVIVNLSRMDSDMTMPTYALIGLAEELDTQYGDIEIVIVGGGNDLENIKQRANEVNKRIGKNIIHITGGRVDANRFFALADIFVGVSRSAQEAMSTGVPVILAGNQGYLGIFNKSTLQAGIDTNFCCRGYQAVTKELIRNDLNELLCKTSEELSILGQFGRKIVMEMYSVDRMADDANALYDIMRKPKRHMDVVVSGYYGSNNHGDDALLQAITDDLRTLKPDINIVVLSHRPKETKAAYNVEACHRFNFVKIYKLLKNTKLLIMGGGTLIQDLTSSQSLFYYLTVTKLAIFKGAKVMLYANGIGPVRNEKNRAMAEKTLNKVDLITLRDDASLDELNKLRVNNTRAVVTADAAFGIKDITDGKDCSDAIFKELGLKNKKFICVALRSWKYLKDGFENDITAYLNSILDKYNYEVLFIPMQKAYDTDISKRIMSGMKKESYIIEKNFTINEILGVIRKAEFLVSMRLHTIIYAAKTGTPVIGLVYDPKVRGMMDVFEQKYYVNVDSFSIDTLMQYTDEVIEKRAVISEKLKSDSLKLEKLAFENAKYAYDIIERNVF